MPASTRRPPHWPATEHVQVEVKDTLPDAGPGVDDDAVATSCDPRAAGCLGGSQAERPEQVAIRVSGLVEGDDVVSRNHKDMHRSAGGDVLECHHFLVFEEKARWSRSVSNATENAAIHATKGSEPLGCGTGVLPRLNPSQTAETPAPRVVTWHVQCEPRHVTIIHR